jgi:hypothetical protein
MPKSLKVFLVWAKAYRGQANVLKAKERAKTKKKVER